MAWGRLEDTFYDDPKFQHIADHIGIDVVTVQGMVARLYSWAVKHRPDGSLDSLTTVYTERTLCRWTGSDGVLLDAFVLHEVIDRDHDGSLTVHGLMERNESYKRAQTKKKEREDKREKRRTTVATVSHDCRPEKRREEKRGEERENTTQPAVADSHPLLKSVDSESNARPTKVMEPLVLAEWDRLRKEFNRPGPDSYDANHHRAAGAIFASYAKESRWQKLLHKFATDGFYQNVGWSLVWLAKNSAQVEGRIPVSATGPKFGVVEKRQVVPTAEESKKHFEKLASVVPADQATSLAALAGIKAKFGMA